MRDGVFRTSLDAIAAEDATTVVDVVNLRVTLIHSSALFGWSRVIFGNDIDALRRARSGAEKTGHTFFTSQLINVKQVLAPITRLDRYRIFGILHSPLALWNV